jgi:hypothetical protein
MPPDRTSRSPRHVPAGLLFGLLALVLMGAVLVRVALTGGDERTTVAAGHSPTTQASARSPSPVLSSKAVSSAPSPTTQASRGSLVIHGAGDTNLDPSYVSTFRTQGYGYAWTGLDGLFQRDDLTVVNLECAVSNLGSPVSKQFNFRGDPAALPAMHAAGVEVANMGNNHSYDFGPEALLDTRANLIRNHIAPVGAGKDPAEANEPAFFTVKGWRIAVLGFDKVVDPWPTAVAAPGHPGTADGHDLDAMVAAVEAAKAKADLVVVDVHWGVELDTQPRSDDVDLGHRMVDAGADVVFGGHSHRLQPLEMFKGRPIFYSLANFVWPNFSVAGATTAVAEVNVSSKGTFTARLIPAFITAPGHPELRGA